VSEQPTSDQSPGRRDSDVSDTTVSDEGDLHTGVDDNVSSADYPDENSSDPWQSDDARRPTQSGDSGV
jgi:hypothetical protein